MGFLQKIHTMSETVKKTVTKKRQKTLFSARQSFRTGKYRRRRGMFDFTNFTWKSQGWLTIVPNTTRSSDMLTVST